MADENGMKCELQLTRPDVWKVKLQSDAIYEKWRNVTDLRTLTPEQRLERANDKARSQKIWNQLDLPYFNIWLSSNSDNIRALNSSSEDTGFTALTQRPSTSSKISLPEYQGEKSSMRPSSVMQATAVPPNIPSGNRIARPEGKGKISAVRSNTLENG